MIVLPAKFLFFMFFVSLECFTFNLCQRLSIHDLTVGSTNSGIVDSGHHIGGFYLTRLTFSGHFAYLASIDFEVMFRIETLYIKGYSAFVR